MKILASGFIISWQMYGETMETVTDFIFLGSKITVDGDCSHEIKRRLLLGRKAMTSLESILKKQRCYFANKDPYSQRCGFMDVRVLKSWCFWTVVLEKTFESPLDSKEIKSVNPKENQSPIFIGRTDAEAKTPILWPPDAKNWLIGKEPDAGKDWRWEQKGTTEHEIVGWRCQLNRHKFEQAPGVGDGQGGQAYCSQWGSKELDTTEQLNLLTDHFHMVHDTKIKRSLLRKSEIQDTTKKTWSKDQAKGMPVIHHIRALFSHTKSL